MNTHPDEASAALATSRPAKPRSFAPPRSPSWYWWAVAAGMVIIGVATDTRRPLALGIAIPLAALFIAGLTVAMILGTGRGARIKSDELLGGRGALLIVGFVWLDIAVTLGLGFGLKATSTPQARPRSRRQRAGYYSRYRDRP